MEQQDCEEDQFYRVLQENLKYAFTSPMATTHAFPTPYSHSQQTKKEMKLTSMGAGLTIDDANDSSLVENSMLPLQGLGHGGNSGSGGNSGTIQTLGGESSSSIGHGGSSSSGVVGKTGKTTSLNDVNAQPSMVLNFENFPNEIFLDSSDQFKEFREFLQDSPASMNLWQAKTPAKTPLKFLQQQHLQQQQQQHTPLQDIDINLMLNSGAKSTVSPSKRLYSLTPYSRKIFGELDTPHRSIPPSSSSNSALVDFQRARKEHANFLMKTPVAKKVRQLNNKRPDVFNSTSTSSPSFVSSLVSTSVAEAGGLHTAPTSVSVNSTNEADVAEGAVVNSTRDDADEDIYGSSPTTIQLASSVTKSARVANLGESPPVASQRDPTVDSRLFDISASPTPKLSKTQSTSSIPLRVPELPKLGSFKSVTARPQLIPSNFKTRSGTGSSAKNALPTVFVGANAGRMASGGLAISKFTPKNKNKPKTGQQQHSTFQFIMTNANSFNINNDGSSLPPKKKLKRTQSNIVSSDQRTQTGRSSSNEVMISTPINQYKAGKKRKRNLSLSQ